MKKLLTVIVAVLALAFATDAMALNAPTIDSGYCGSTNGIWWSGGGSDAIGYRVFRAASTNSGFNWGPEVLVYDTTTNGYVTTYLDLNVDPNKWYRYRVKALSATTASDYSAPFTCQHWEPVGTPPISDAQAAAFVVHKAETRPENATYNNYVPTDSELSAFYNAGSFNPYTQYVTGRPGLTNPSTDDLIQWATHKWGLPTDLGRAEAVQESNWYQLKDADHGFGDCTTYSNSTLYNQQPAVARNQAGCSGTNTTWASLGIMQIKWMEGGGSLSHPGTEPLRWKSTAFNLDYWGATLRYYYDGLCDWCSSGYSAGQDWNSVGAWFSPSPWGTSTNYITGVQNHLKNRDWPQ